MAEEKPQKGKTFFERLTGSIKTEGTGEETKRVNLKEGKPSETTPKPQEDTKEQSWMEQAQQEGQLTIDVYQTDNDIVIKSTVAGVVPEALDVTITNDMVTIKGRREKDEEVPQQNYYYQECYWGAFSRSVILPVDVAADRAAAGLKNGILTIRLPKLEKEQTKKIRVKPEP